MTYNPRTFGQIARFVTEEDITGGNAGIPLVSEDIFSVDGAPNNIPQSTWADIGPTGSGATYIWTALDSLSLDTEWLQLRIKHVGIGGAASTAVFGRIYLRKNGSAAPAASATLSCEMYEWADSGGNAWEEQVTFPLVGLDSSNIFEVYYVNTFSADSIELWLAGYGVNG